jgi:HKD family nuclease
MISVDFVDNETKHLERILTLSLNEAHTTRVAVAYLKNSGLQLIDDALVSNLRNGGKIQFLVGLGFGATDKESLLQLQTLSNEFPNLECKVFVGGEFEAAEFHPKVYYFEAGDHVEAIVGSPNLTRGGLESNIEAFVVVRADHKSDFVKQIAGYLDSLWEDPQSAAITGEVLSTYEPLTRSRYESDKRVADLWKPVTMNLTSLIGAGQTKGVRYLAYRLIPTMLTKEQVVTVAEIYDKVKARFPNLCRDEEKCNHEPNSKRPEWQHQVRWTVFTLKKEKRILRVGFDRYMLA